MAEIVLTTLKEHMANPLVRYRTGDAARFVETPCRCGRIEPRIELLGRIGGDTIRMAGGEVKIEEVDRVMATLGPYVEPDFFVEIGEEEHGQTIAATFTIHVRKRPLEWLDERTLKEQVTSAFLKEFRLSPKMRLEEAVAAGLVMPVRVETDTHPARGEKHKRIIRTS